MSRVPCESRGGAVSVLKVLPDLRAGGGAQMALDDGLLDSVEQAVARRYTWAPPALSLGKFQRVELVRGLPFEVVLRPTGGRAVLHGEAFEWSFAVAFGPGALGAGVRRAADVARPYEAVSASFAAALSALGVELDEARAEPYTRSSLCFSTRLRQDLSVHGEKVVAMAQARRDGRVLVHGSVLECRPPEHLVAAAEALLGEPWTGEGLAAAAGLADRDMVWRRVLVHLEGVVRGLVPLRDAQATKGTR